MKREESVTGICQSSDEQSSLPSMCQETSAIKKPYELLVDALANDPSIKKEVALGERIGFYKIGEQIGCGSFSKVNIGIHCLTNEKVAIKIMEKSKMNQHAQKSLVREIKAMEQLHHPNIIHLFECVETISRVYIIMEYAGYGELYTHINYKGKLPEDDCKPIFAQIVSAILYMHSKNIVHRDIKAENVILSQSDWVKLADFGFACQVRPNDRLSTFCGSPPYAAPELFKTQNYFGPNVDIWAVGVLLYFMLVGHTPFHGETINDLKQSILRGIYPLPNYLSIPAQRAISQMLVIDPIKRSTIYDIKNCNFLKGCKLTKPYIQCHMISDEKELIENPIALKIHNTLRVYGIDEALISDASSRGVRDAITGTFRIVLHKAQQEYDKQRRNRIPDHRLLLKREKTLPVFTTESKTCSVL